MGFKKNASRLLLEYINFLNDYQCSSEATIAIRRNFVTPFLTHLQTIGQPSQLFRLSAKTIHDYMIATAQPMHRASKKHLASSIRSFLKFAYIKGYLKKDLREAVPVITTRKLDSLPQSISWNDTKKLLTMPNRKTSAGRRDYAILLLLINYGVRIGQITRLNLQDIHWQEGSIVFAASKHGNTLRLPLHKKVADALLSYIKQDRKNSAFKNVFLTLKTPQRPLSKYNHYYTCLKKYFVKIGNNTSCAKGSHVIRHAFATQLVNQGVPIKIISDLLGHKWIDTTFIYTKVDVIKLRELSIDWPEVR